MSGPGTIGPCLDHLLAIEEALAITSPGPFRVTKAYRAFLDPQYALPGPRVFQNEWTFGPVRPERRMALRELDYAVRIQFLAAEAIADSTQAVLIAEAFWEALLEACCQDQSLGHTCTSALLRGAEPTLGLVTRGNKSYIGFEAFLDVSKRNLYLWK